MTNPLGETTAAVVGLSVGIAGADAVEPPLERAKQQAWARNPYKVLELMALAELVAQEIAAYPDAQAEAKLSGFDANHFAAAVELAKAGPDLDTALESWRKGLFGDPESAAATALARHAIRKAAIEPQYDAAILDLYNARLSPQEIALGIVRSVIADPGLLVTTLDTSDSNVPRYKPLDIDALEEAKAWGVDRERLRGLVGEVGLPMAAIMAANAYYRGILTRGGYNQAILEGDTRPEWADAILEASRQIPSVVNFVENHLRGYSGEDEMNAGAYRHGMTPEDARVIFQNAGRPLNVHQITTGLARGGTFNPEPGELTDPYDASVHESDVKPAYYDLAKANRYSYPSGFQIRAEAQSGNLTEPDTEQILLEIGWSPKWAAFFASRWTSGGSAAQKEATVTDLLTLFDGGKATEAETLAAIESLGYPAAEAQRKVDLIAARRVASAKGTAITDIHAKYKALGIDADVATAAITSLGVPADSAAAIVAAWGAAVGAVEPT